MLFLHLAAFTDFEYAQMTPAGEKLVAANFLPSIKSYLFLVNS